MLKYKIIFRLMEPITLKDNQISDAAASISALLTLLNKKMDSVRKTTKKTFLKHYTSIFFNNINDPETIRKSLSGFSRFFFAYSNLTPQKLLEMPKGFMIQYGNATTSTFGLEIQMYVYKSREDPEFLKALCDRLLAIKPFCAKIPTFPGIEEGSDLDLLIKDIFPEISEEIRKIGGKELTPEAAKSLISSKAAQKLTDKLASLYKEGKINPEIIFEQIEKAMSETDDRSREFFRKLKEAIKHAEKQEYVEPEEAQQILDELGE